LRDLNVAGDILNTDLQNSKPYLAKSTKFITENRLSKYVAGWVPVEMDCPEAS
jgi:hypothetical protein